MTKSGLEHRKAGRVVIILPAPFLATPEVSVPPVGSVDGGLGSVGGWFVSADSGFVIVDDSITGADVCCCHCR